MIDAYVASLEREVAAGVQSTGDSRRGDGQSEDNGLMHRYSRQNAYPCAELVGEM